LLRLRRWIARIARSMQCLVCESSFLVVYLFFILGTRFLLPFDKE
jgi:hypothetical protein